MTKRSPTARREPPAKKEEVVACIDDDPAVLAALTRLLGGEPYRLRTTADPDEALEWVRRREVDILIADERMPGVSGRELLRSVRGLDPGLTLVVLTGFPDSGTIQDRISRAVDRLITKPWHDEDLKRTIRELLYLRRTGSL